MSTTQCPIKGTETEAETWGPTLFLRQTEAKVNFDEGPSLIFESGKGLDELKIFTNLCSLNNPLPTPNFAFSGGWYFLNY